MFLYWDGLRLMLYLILLHFFVLEDGAKIRKSSTVDNLVPSSFIGKVRTGFGRDGF